MKKFGKSMNEVPNGFRARSRKTPRSRGRTDPLYQAVSIAIVSSQSPLRGRNIVLFGSLNHRNPAAPPRVRIMHIE